MCSFQINFCGRKTTTKIIAVIPFVAKACALVELKYALDTFNSFLVLLVEIWILKKFLFSHILSSKGFVEEGETGRMLASEGLLKLRNVLKSLVIP